MEDRATSDWHFERDDGVAGFMRSQRVSTDALNALNAWKAKDARREYEVLAGYEADDFMDVRLSTTKTDVSAGGALDGLAREHGVMRRPL